MTQNIKVTYFFRKPQPQYHSIERVFGIIAHQLEGRAEICRYHMKSGEKGFFSRITALFEARREKNSINHITGDISYVALGLPRKGLVVTFHDLESLERSNRIKFIFLKWLWVVIPARKAQKITVISEHTKNKVVQWSAVHPSKIHVIPNPLPGGFDFHPKAFNTKKPVILAMGTKQNKNLEGVIQAVSQINCHLMIAGKLSARQEALLKEHAVEYENLQGASDAKIIEAYQKCDLLCFPSFFEGFGMPIIEAQSVGRPVITSNQGAMKEIAGEGAALVNPNRPQEIREAIERVIKESDYRNRLIELGRENAKRFAPEKVVAQYERMYSELH